jgi:membrane protein DedA with SNARE-associated domain
MTFDALAALILAHGYIVVFIAVALDCAALPIPGELLLLTLGGLAGQGHLDPGSGIAAAAAGVLVADAASYWVGRLHGQRVFSRVRIGERWTPGITTLVFGRFVIGARVMVAPIAGARRLPFARFVLFDALGAMVWAGLFVLIGYAAGARIATIQQHWASVAPMIQGLLLLLLLAFVGVRLMRATRLKLVVGAALLAIWTIRGVASEALDFDAPRLKHDQALVRVWSA